jgi:methyl coenzyme M reductase beta subunit
LGLVLIEAFSPSWKQAEKEIALQWRRSVATNMARFEGVIASKPKVGGDIARDAKPSTF